MSRAVLERFRADWRRGRALKQLKLGERQYWEWDSETAAGTICAYMTFEAEGETLELTFHEMWAKDESTITIEGKHGARRADLTLTGVRAFLALVAGLATDAGFSRLRVGGQRTRHRRTRAQRFEFDLARYRRGQA
jgi:hypothetical protein